MSNINDFFKAAPDLLRTGMDEDQLAKLLANMLCGNNDSDKQEVSEREQSDGKMPLSEIRRILENGEWLNRLPDSGDPDAPLDELQSYHDAEADGRMLPVRIGQTVYQIEYVLRSYRVEEYTVTGIGINVPNSVAQSDLWIKDFKGIRDYKHLEDLGKSVFLTRAEAEAAIKEREAQHGA